MGGVDKPAARRPPMRSSIACLRCRRSKIKCDNDGGIAPCDTCIKQGKECVYPEATPLPPKRPEAPPPPPKPDRELAPPDRKRSRKADDMSRLENQYSAQLYADEILSAPYLNEPLWLQIFDIFKLHFATELPFLHIPTLKEKMGDKFRPNNGEASPDTNLLLLGVLTLTARFHHDLVKYIAHATTTPVGSVRTRPMQNRPDAAAASEYFAEALAKGLRTTFTLPSLERVQAFLMLGLFEWSQARPKNHGGFAAWMHIGAAIRMAQAIGLGYGDRPDSIKKNLPRDVAVAPKKSPLRIEEEMIMKEVRRRTMFSCLILDRMLACGKGRVFTIQSSDLQIQLPCTEIAFDLSEDVSTGFLKPRPGDAFARPVNNDSVLSRFIKLVDLWGEISKFSFAGGRLAEIYPPWDKRGAFCQLREALDSFYHELPPTFTLSTSNYHKHENHQASSVYVSLHMLGSVCQIMLHREYVPFIPLRTTEPTGPLDAPTFPPSEYDIPPNFWKDSAEQLFRSARNIVHLVEICRDKLPMSALAVFAIWTAGFVGLYACHFPYMDEKGYMLAEDDDEDREEGAEHDITKSGPTGLTFQTLTKMSAWLKMANTYVQYFTEMDKYYVNIKEAYEVHQRLKAAAAAQEGTAKEIPKEIASAGVEGGGLTEWASESSKILDYGSILNEVDGRHGQYEDSDRSRASTIDRGSSLGPDSYVQRAKTPKSAPPSFTPINTFSGLRGLQHPMQFEHQPPPPPPPRDSRQDVLPPLIRDASGSSWASYTGQMPPGLQQSPTQPYTLAHPISGEPMTYDDFLTFLDSHETLRWETVQDDLTSFSMGDISQSGTTTYSSEPPEGHLFSHHAQQQVPVPLPWQHPLGGHFMT